MCKNVKRLDRLENRGLLTTDQKEAKRRVWGYIKGFGGFFGVFASLQKRCTCHTKQELGKTYKMFNKLRKVKGGAGEDRKPEKRRGGDKWSGNYYMGCKGERTKATQTRKGKGKNRKAENLDWCIDRWQCSMATMDHGGESKMTFDHAQREGMEKKTDIRPWMIIAGGSSRALPA